MGRRRKTEEKIDSTKACRCGSGFYCHRHQRYGTDSSLINEAGSTSPNLYKVPKKRGHKGRVDMGGQY